ncbi:MAG: hypothetical protein ACW98I_06830 [Candidatus Hodarchaeales archaeon]
MIIEYLNKLEEHLKSIDIFADYSFSYKIDQDAGTLFDSRVLESQEPTLDYVLRYIKKFL